MATLNLSTNGPSITKSYQSIVNSPPLSGPAAQSATYGQWAVYSVSAPLVNAFQQDAGGKESILKVQSTGEGELVDLIDDFSDGRVQFAFIKVKDPNTMLPKYVLIGWCGEGVPERTKGYFTSHLAAVARVLHGYHVQITARSDRDLTPQGIVQKVSDASGSKYSAEDGSAAAASLPPLVASKPVFMPTRSNGGSAGFNPLASTTPRPSAPRVENTDKDGWGQDAPQVTRTQLEKVPSAYQPTKVNMRELSLEKQESARSGSGIISADRNDVVTSVYQPIGKVDIAALRREAQNSSLAPDDRPTVIKGSYEPVGKVDIAAIRAKAQPSSERASSPVSRVSPAATGTSAVSSEYNEPRSVAHRVPNASSERLTTLPRPKVANRFSSSAGNFAGTRAPVTGTYGIESKLSPSSPPVGASRTFADEGGKTPAQIWAERKARARGLNETQEQPNSPGVGGPTSPMASQNSGGGEWKSGYSGKSWAAVQTVNTGQSSGRLGQQGTGENKIEQNETSQSLAGGVGALRDKFRDATSTGIAEVDSERSAPNPPLPDNSSKPNVGRGVPIPSLPPKAVQGIKSGNYEQESLPPPPLQPPRSPSPPTPAEEEDEETGSPIRVAVPVRRGEDIEVEDARNEQFSPPPAMPARSLVEAASHEEDLAEEPSGYDAARGAGQTAAVSSFGHEALHEANSSSHESGKRALVQYDYEKAEDNELELKEGEVITNIEMVDDDWWMGENPRGETGLFPSNYVELVEDSEHHEHAAQPEPVAKAAPLPGAARGHAAAGPTATAIYDYEAAEDNELSFPENAKITDVGFPDEDWWSGEYDGKSGLFPSNYVQLDE
ncbi:hypothetical protein MMC13_005705 [Lambiella insularis]|nr:hypothetical protein [Lambiella insularis]